MSNRTMTTDTMLETSLPSVVRQALQTVRAHLEVARSRRRLRDELGRCSDRELADMGLSRSEIDSVAAGIRTH